MAHGFASAFRLISVLAVLLPAAPAAAAPSFLECLGTQTTNDGSRTWSSSFQRYYLVDQESQRVAYIPARGANWLHPCTSNFRTHSITVGPGQISLLCDDHRPDPGAETTIIDRTDGSFRYRALVGASGRPDWLAVAYARCRRLDTDPSIPERQAF